MGDARAADEQRQPAARLTDGSIRDRAAVSPAVARLLFQASTGSVGVVDGTVATLSEAIAATPLPIVSVAVGKINRLITT